MIYALMGHEPDDEPWTRVVNRKVNKQVMIKGIVKVST